MTDAQAVERARGGDHDAFRVLVERYQDRVYRLARRILRDDEWARDAAQEAFLKVYRALRDFEGRSGFYTWLYRVTVNLCLDMRRRDRSSLHVEWDEERAAKSESDGSMDTSAPTAGPLQALERAELRQRMAEAIGALPEDARQTLLLREVDGMSYVEIAQTLQIPKGTVMSRLYHARRKVKQALLDAGVDPTGRDEA